MHSTQDVIVNYDVIMVCVKHIGDTCFSRSSRRLKTVLSSSDRWKLITFLCHFIHLIPSFTARYVQPGINSVRSTFWMYRPHYSETLTLEKMFSYGILEKDLNLMGLWLTRHSSRCWISACGLWMALSFRYMVAIGSLLNFGISTRDLSRAVHA